MSKDYLKYSFRYELKNNRDKTQNLFLKSYQNSLLICETDCGDISNIVSYKKENDKLKQSLNNIRGLISNSKWDWKLIEDILQIAEKVLGDEK